MRWRRTEGVRAGIASLASPVVVPTDQNHLESSVRSQTQGTPTVINHPAERKWIIEIKLFFPVATKCSIQH